MLSLQDPLRLAKNGVLVPQMVVPLLALCDGTRDLARLRTAYLLQTGISLTPNQVEGLIDKLDHGLLLDNRRFHVELERALDRYHTSPYREPILAGGGYPEEVGQLVGAMEAYTSDAGPIGERPPGKLVGLISPHIDYLRGWRTYAQTWGPAKTAVREAELIVMLGTDHAGSVGSFALTRQSYATPWGTLPNDIGLVDRLAEALGEEAAFAEEAHHIGEHSIELASVWLHYMAEGQPKRVVPILCGPYDPISLEGDGNHHKREQVIEILSDVAGNKRTLVVAAGDLSHVGPAFGDQLPFDGVAKAHIRNMDEQWLDAARSGEPGELRGYILKSGDKTRICGTAPIYYMLGILQGAKGQVVAYDQCPADEEFGSLVSVAGVLYTL